jgi:hypothetical protein
MRTTPLRTLLLALGAVLVTVTPRTAAGQLPADFGLPTPLVATGPSVRVSYYGWENTTFYGHTLWALTSAQYTANLGTNCFAWAGGGTCEGTAMFTKSFGTSTNPYLEQPTPAAPLTYDLSWISGTELVLALQVNMNNNWMWFFSGAPSRNADGLAHVAYFGTDGVAGDDGIGIIPGTIGLYAFGFEDAYYSASDWDFDNAIFTILPDDISPPTEVVPEPATMTLIGSGLIGLAAARRRRRLDPDA